MGPDLAPLFIAKGFGVEIRMPCMERLRCLCAFGVVDACLQT